MWMGEMERRTLWPDKATLRGILRTPGAWGQKVIGQERWPRWRPSRLRVKTYEVWQEAPSTGSKGVYRDVSAGSTRRPLCRGQLTQEVCSPASFHFTLLISMVSHVEGAPQGGGTEGGCLWSLCELAPSPPAYFLMKTTGKKAVWGLCLYSCLQEDSWDLEIRETALTTLRTPAPLSPKPRQHLPFSSPHLNMG